MKNRAERRSSREELLELVAGAKQFKDFLPFIEGDLQKSGVDIGKLRETFDAVDPLYERVKELLDLPKRFNAHFVPRGWVAYELLNLDVIRAAVALADQGDLQAAEQRLADHYDDTTMLYGINSLKQVEAFRPRLRLLKLAAEDYSAGRYHACIPVVLAQIDGVVSDLRGQGFFAEGADLTAWDSVSASEDGLVRLAKVLSKGRTRTRDEALTVPYRNGVMHGRDLRYDTKLAAAKAWGVLFALRELGLRTEREPEGAAAQPVELSLEEELARLQKVQEEGARDRERIAAWKPRGMIVGQDIPESGPPEAYPDGSPERVAVQFLAGWQRGNYGAMAACVTSSLHPPKKRPGLMRAQFEHRALKAFKVLAVEDRGAAVSTVVVALEQEVLGRPVLEERQVHLLYADAERNVLVRGDEGGAWVITVWP